MRQPSVSLCEGSTCSSSCASTSSGDSCSLLGLSTYAAVTCSEFGTLSMKICSDKSCDKCATVANGGCASIDILGIGTVSVKASCGLTPLAIGVIVVSVLLFLLCLCCCGLRSLCSCCCASTDANAAVMRLTVVTRSEESTPLVSRHEIELREQIAASQRKLVEMKRRVEAAGQRQAQVAAAGQRQVRDALFERGHAARLDSGDPDILSVPLRPAVLASASATPRFKTRTPEVDYWPQLDEPGPSGPLTMGSFKKPFESGADK